MSGSRLGAVVLAGGRGSRMGTGVNGAKHLLPVPGHAGGAPVPLLDHVLGRLAGVDEIVVATGHRGDLVERHVRTRWPAARCVPVPDVDDLPTSIAAAVGALGTPAVVVLEGDVIVPRAALARYLAEVRRDGGARDLWLLAGPKPVAAHRCTLDADPDGTVRAVRRASPADRYRLSVLAGAPGAAVRADLALLTAAVPALAGVAASRWHHAAARLLGAGRPVRVSLAPDGGVNVNTRAELAATAAYLADDP